jgi:RecA/RadA recombinase
MTDLTFLKNFQKELEKAGIDAEASSEPPRYWFNTGNFVLNRIISGSFLKGIPQGRITNFSGPSGSGKSFICCNVMREAQREDAYIIVLDSENALDNDFVSKIGVDVHNNYTYVPIDTISQLQNIASKFIKQYKDTYGKDPNAPKVLMIVDSLDMLLTETEEENFGKGVFKGDQGQRSKQLKAVLRQLVQAIKNINMSIICTSQVYKNQDMTNGEGVWIINDAIKFSLSQIIMLTKLKLRDDISREVQGIRMKCEGYKTRFTKPFQTVTIEVPYDSGMDPYNGLLEVAVELKVIEKRGPRYALAGDTESWFSRDFNQRAADILAKCEAKRETFLEGFVNDDELDISPVSSAKQKRIEKVQQTSDTE